MNEATAQLDPADHLFFLDEACSEVNKPVTKRWWPIGQRPTAGVEAHATKIQVIGAIDATSATGIFATKSQPSTAASIITFLRELDTRYPAGRLLVVLDNARIHHAKMVQAWCQREGHRFDLIFLPPYSPDLNPIEVFWRGLKHAVFANQYYATRADALQAVQAYLEQFKCPGDPLKLLLNLSTWFREERFSA